MSNKKRVLIKRVDTMSPKETRTLREQAISQAKARATQVCCDKWNAEHPVGTKVIFTDYWGKKHTGTTGEPAKVVYGKAVVWLKEPTLAARYELERIQVMKTKRHSTENR